MLESIPVHEIQITADELVGRLLNLSRTEPVSILDSCGVGHLGSHLLIAGIRPSYFVTLEGNNATDTLRSIDEELSGDRAAIFTLSYDLGLKVQNLRDRSGTNEPDAYIAGFNALVIHDYDIHRTYLVGHAAHFDEVLDLLSKESDLPEESATAPSFRANFSKPNYVRAVQRVREHIRAGDTYQANLTQQITCSVPDGPGPETVFRRLRQEHPAPFAGYIQRGPSAVVSASPERFFRIDRDRWIETSPIKGTRGRGSTPEEDERLRTELVTSEKDRAENTMIVDLMRNDLGRVCEFGSVTVVKLCDIEEHPTLFHLVSTVRGKLRPEVSVADILKAVFPCGSITGAPKIRTMQIIDEIEPSSRGLSMGALGVYLPESWRLAKLGVDTVLDVSVAIRTMVFRDGKAVFNVGGGVVIDSDPEKEFDESMLKAMALLNALGVEVDS